ncbi:lipopolysaccharide biosynthesis protein [Methylomonas sp. MgM2]
MKPLIVKNVTILFSGTILQKIITFGALFYYTRNFSPDELSIIPIYYLVTNLSHVFFGFGIQAYIMKKIPALLCTDQLYAKALIRKILLLAYSSGFLFGICFFLISYTHSFTNELRLLTKTGILMFSIGAAFECMNASQREILLAAKKVKAITYLNIGKAILLPSLILILNLNTRADEIASALSVVSFLSFIFTRFMQGNLVKDISPLPNVKLIEIIKESWPYYLESGLMLLRRQGDQIAIATFMSTESLGIYYVAQRLGEMIWSFVQQIDAVLTPELSQKAAVSKTALKDTFDLLIRSAMYISTPIALISISLVPVYIQVVTDNNYQSASIPAAILCFKIIPDIMRTIVIGRTVLVSCSSIARFKMTFFETIVLVPLSISAAMSGDINLVALAPITSAIISGIYGIFLLKKKINARFPISEIFFLISSFTISLYASNYKIWISSNPILNSIAAMTVALFIYIILFVNVVNVNALRFLFCKLVPNRLNFIIDILLLMRIKNGGHK